MNRFDWGRFIQPYAGKIRTASWWRWWGCWCSKARARTSTSHVDLNRELQLDVLVNVVEHKRYVPARHWYSDASGRSNNDCGAVDRM